MFNPYLEALDLPHGSRLVDLNCLACLAVNSLLTFHYQAKQCTFERIIIQSLRPPLRNDRHP